MARAFQEYVVYQPAHAIVLAVYGETSKFPKTEIFGLTSQMRRSAQSIPTNIAEGSAFDGKEFRRFLGMALGSATELEYQFILAADLGYLPRERSSELQRNIREIQRMLVAFRQRLSDQTQ